MVSAATLDMTVPRRHKNWKITPSHVSTSRCTFWMRTFLLKLASAQHTLNNDSTLDTMFRSLNVRNWCCWLMVGGCTITGVTCPAPSVCSGISGFNNAASSFWMVTKMYNWSRSIGAASQNACTSRSMHKSRTSCFTCRKSTGTKSFAYRHSTPSCVQCKTITQYRPNDFGAALFVAANARSLWSALSSPVGVIGFFLSMLSVDDEVPPLWPRILCRYQRSDTICARKNFCESDSQWTRWRVEFVWRLNLPAILSATPSPA